MPFETFDHTADVGLRVRAESLDQLLAESGKGLMGVLCEKPETIELRDSWNWSIEVEPGENEDLLFDWLCEVLYLFDAEHVLLAEFQVEWEGGKLLGSARGEPIDHDRHVIETDVKAITYHRLRVEQEPTGDWIAEVILDL